MEKWVDKYSGTRQLKEYAMFTYVLIDDEGYLMGEYRIDIKSWEEDIYNKNYKTAGVLSEHKYTITFRDRTEASRVWRWIVKNEPTYEELKTAGFKKSLW